MNLTIAAISALATVLAALIYYWTLRELKRQRQNTYRPYLFIDKKYFKVTGVQRNQYIMPLEWTDEVKGELIIKPFSYNSWHPVRNGFALECFNIGFGTATNVSINFSYEMEEFVRTIRELEETVPEDLRIRLELKNHFIALEPINEEVPFVARGLAINNNPQQYISYILPAHIKNTSTDIKLPAHFLELTNVYILYLSQQKGR